jgi:membrane associated rhomboid family serine protease
MILPLTHERNTVSKLPWVSFTIIGLCLLSFLATRRALDESAGFSQSLQGALDYYFEHPYLKLDPRLVPPESKPLLDQALREEGMRVASPGSASAALEQAELDRLTREWIDRTDRNAIWRNGLIPASIRPPSLITHMFLHGGLMHLLGNLFFFYLLGPFVEDVWGRKWFTAFYLAAGLCAGLLYAAHYPHLYRPLIGASGAIAGVMGAFVVLHGRTKIRFLYYLGILFGTFRAPAWLMLPLWFLVELFTATSKDRLEPGGVIGGTANWAHVWGFAFGVAAALVLKRFKVGEVDDSVPPPTAAELARDEWEEAVNQGNAVAAAAVGQRLIRAEIQAGAIEEAVTHFRQLRSAAPEAVDPAAAVRLIEECLKKSWREDAADILRTAVAVLGPDAPLGLTLKLVRLAASIDKNLHQDAVEKALQRPDLTPELRGELDGQYWRI